MELPEVTQQPILHIDATPNEDYVLRILRAYRKNCDCRWASTEPNALIDMMNERCDQRAALLDKAIASIESSQSVPPCLPHTDERVAWGDENLIDNDGNFIE